MALLDLILGKNNPASQWVDANPNAISAFSSGLASGQNFSDGLSNAVRLLPSGQAADKAAQLTQNGQNQTIQYLHLKGYDDLVPLVAGGNGAGALKIASDRDQAALKAKQPVVVSRNGALVDPTKPAGSNVLYQAPAQSASPGALIQGFNLAKSQGYTGDFIQYQKDVKSAGAPYKPTGADASGLKPGKDMQWLGGPWAGHEGGEVPIPMGPADTMDDPVVVANAKGIASGQLPPLMTGNSKLAYYVKANLAKMGIDLTRQQEDFTATQKRLATMNNQQQTQVTTSIGLLKQQLPALRALSDQWKRSNYPTFNSIQQLLDNSGATGSDRNILATKIKALIGEITPELSRVYSGGNASTDKALDLAATQLSSTWSNTTLQALIDQAQQNLGYRERTMNSLGTAGFPNSQYNPTTNPPAAAQPPAGAIAPPPPTTPSAAPEAAPDVSKMSDDDIKKQLGLD
jgi:hypothetical protein